MLRTYKTPHNKREPNIEILKVISMFMIVVWHFYVHGLSIDNIDYQESFTYIFNFTISQLLIVICSICVNMFVLVTGFFLIGKGFNTIRFVKVWFLTVFYSIIIDFALYLSSTDFNIVSNIWTDIMPIRNDTYWFVKQYLRLIIIAPLLSFCLSRLSKTTHHIIMALIITITLILTIKYPFGGTRYLTGHSIFFFIMLFYTGGYLRTYGIPYKWLKSIKTFWFIVILTWIFTLSIMFYEHLYLKKGLSNTLYEYNTFPYFLSVILFVYIKNCKLKHTKFLSYLYNIAPLTFGVYLIHDNNNIRSLIWKDLYSWDTLYDTLLLTPIAIFISCIIFTLCISIDYARKKLFKVLGIDYLLYTFSYLIDSILMIIWNKLIRAFEKFKNL